MRITITLLFCVSSWFWANGQGHKRIATIVHLDSFVVTASRQGFDTEDFVRLVREDESFYKAFQNLRLTSYYSDNQITVFDKKREEEATYFARIHQQAADRCRSMTLLAEEPSNRFFKRKRKHRYFTAKMHEELFFTEGTVCEEATPQKELKGIDKRIEQLKLLIFQPGDRIDIPFVADKTAIFEEKMIPYYDYGIESGQYQNEIDCYVFTVREKAGIPKDKTIIKYLETYFDKSTFQIVARKYQIKYNGFAFDCDVEMDIQLTKIGQKYVPAKVSYSGNWHIPTQKREIVDFTLSFWDFE